jgi:hypothetical protein
MNPFMRHCRFVVMFLCWLALCLSVGQRPAAAGDYPVQLYYAKMNFNYYHGSPCGFSVSGKISVESLGGSEKVYVHYTYGDGEWVDVEAVYQGKAADGRSVWNFRTKDSAVPYSYYEYKCQFAIRYEVNGKVYWDNNGGADYSLYSSNMNKNGNTHWILGKSVLILDHASRWNNAYGDITGEIILKNLAYEKNVRVIYTTDNWQTVREAYAYYKEPMTDNLEKWAFTLPDTKSCNEVQFCLAYTVNGVTYWDNNFTLNYKCY